MKKEAIFITQWKDEMKERLKIRFKDKLLNEKKIDKYLDSLIEKRIQNPKVQIYNNYREQSVTTDLLSLIDTIHEHQLIIGGGGALYVQHDTEGRENVMFDFIITKQKERAFHKKERKKYEKYSDAWVMEENFQLNVKILINSLYG